MRREQPPAWVEYGRNVLNEFFLWALSVDLTQEIDETIRRKVEEVLQHPLHNVIFFSIEPHSGHSDNLIVKRSLEKIFPSLWRNILFIADEKTWSRTRNKFLAKLTIGQIFLFDKERKEREYLLEAQEELIETVTLAEPEKVVIALYPQATRDPEAKPGSFAPTTLARAQEEGKYGAIIVCRIEGAREVLPKVPPEQELRQFASALKRRVRRFFKGGEHKVTFSVIEVMEGFTLLEDNEVEVKTRREMMNELAEIRATTLKSPQLQER